LTLTLINPAFMGYTPTPFGSTGVRGLTRGLATLPTRWIQEPLVVRDGWKTPKMTLGDVLLRCVSVVHYLEFSLG